MLVMTRNEEIEREAHRISQNGDEYHSFIQGAEYADKTMCERVLNFIFKYFYDHPHVNGHICTDSFPSLEVLEEKLIKVMQK